MKKYMMLLLVVFILISSFPYKVEAATSNFGSNALLLGKTMTKSTIAGGGTSTILTDNNDATLVDVTPDAYFYYDFTQYEYVDRVYLRIAALSASYLSSGVCVRLTFVDNTTENICQNTITINKVDYYLDVVNKTKLVKSTRVYGILAQGGNFTYEFDLRRNVNLDNTPPAVPSGLTANPSNQTVQLNWNPNGESDLAGYNIYMNDSKHNTALITETEYIINPINNNQVYAFQISAVDNNGNESARSSTVTSIFDTISPLAPIGLVSTPQADGQTILTWEANTEPDLAGYNVYQDNTVINGSLVLSPTYTVSDLLENQTYYFNVTALDTSSNESQKSLTVTYFIDSDAPGAPQNLTGVYQNGVLQLTWQHSTAVDLLGYNVYRNGNKVNSDPVTQANFTLSNLTPGSTYNIYVTAVDTSGNISPGSNVFQFSVPEPEFPPIAPFGVFALQGNGGATVKWSAVPNSDGYNLYLDDTKANTDLITATSFQLTGLENGETYTAAVTAVNQHGESERSEVVLLMPAEGNLPFIDLNYSLKDISDGTGTWFGSTWLILAFSIAIPLAFYVAQRAKQLFS